MREIMKILPVTVDGKSQDFRLTKLDAFSGAELLRMLAGMPAGGGDAGETVSAVFTSLPSPDLRNLMTSCLNHTEVLLPAGYQPVMQGNAWGWPELEHDAASCLKLTVEEVLWTLEGFFGGSGPASRPAAPASTPAGPRT